MSGRRPAALLAAAVALGCSVGSQAGITVDTLLDEMTDLNRLAELPSPPYVARQFSSYDRRSKSPADAEGWFANADRGNYLRAADREGRKEYVMMDADGPGAIVRIWSANPDGRIWFYLDDGAQPVLVAKMKELLGGAVPGLPPPIAGERARGFNLYFPIPYAKHCKVTCEERSLYYQIDYRTYPAGTDVATFAEPDLERLAGKVRQVAERLKAPAQAGVPTGEVSYTDWKLTLAPKQAGTLAEVPGPGMIAEIRAALAAANLEVATAGVVLEMEFDGQRTVECPLGDFFGTAPGLNAFESLPEGVASGERPEMWAHWRMPFARSAKIALKNLSSQKVELAGKLAVQPYAWTDRSLLFHAKWRIQRDLPARPLSDWTHLECTGAGRFVGGVLHVVNPVRDWWGEGDEKIYVDGERFPSIFGTGSEDYYGYAWGSTAPFTHAYHNQVHCDGPGNYGHTCLSRFHVLDDVPFRERFKFDMENWQWNVKAALTRSAASFWYARPGGTDFFKPIAPADVVPVEVPAYVIRHVSGAIEGEDLKVVAKTGRTTGEELNADWSGEKQIRWSEAGPGDKLVLSFTSIEAGVRHVIVRLTRASDCAQVQLYVNDHKAGGMIDLFGTNAEPTEEIDLGPCELVAGENRLTAEIVGANPKAKPAYLFGLDYLKIQ